MSNYEITEKDIEMTINYLRIFHPEHADREFATGMLEFLHAGIVKIRNTDPEGLEEIYRQFIECGDDK